MCTPWQIEYRDGLTFAPYPIPVDSLSAAYPAIPAKLGIERYALIIATDLKGGWYFGTEETLRAERDRQAVRVLRRFWDALCARAARSTP